MAESKQLQQENRNPEKRRISCRYFVRGSCREGNKCAYSHDRSDVPVCRYFQEGTCYYGDKCWFQHPEEEFNISSCFEEYLVPSENFFSLGSVFSNCAEPPPLSNINLLMAAAISSAWSEVNSNEAECETPKTPISVEKAMEMWRSITDEGEQEKCQNLNTSVDDSSESVSALDDLSVYFSKLSKFDIKNWPCSDVIDLLCLLAEFDDVGFPKHDLSNDLFVGNVLIELMRRWKPSSSTTSEFFSTLCESKQIDMTQLIICLVSCPCRLNDFDTFLGEVLYHLQQKNPDKWNSEWVADLLDKFEDNLECCDVDAVDVLSSLGNLLKNPGKLGKMAHVYLEKTGLQNSFECRCKTAECLCPIEVDEGVAFILFDGLTRRLKWSYSEKKEFFCKAVDKLFLPGVLFQLGESMGLRNIAKECNCRDEPDVNKVNNVPQSKCPSSDCSNNAKRDCVNGLCGRCCKRSGLWCDVHVNLFPTRYQTVRAHDLVKPRVNLAAKQDLHSFLETSGYARAVCFGRDFSVTDDDVIKVLDLCEDIQLLELGSADTGRGGLVTDAVLHYISRKRPTLRKLRLESATSVTDDGVMELLKQCHDLEFLEVSGNDKVNGALTDRVLKEFFDVDVAPKLKTLIVTDQRGISYDVVMRLRRCRPTLEITAGDTDSDSMAWSLILGMTGGWYGEGLY